MLNKISYYSCNQILFEPGSIPQDIRRSGISLFGSRATTIQKLSQAIWAGSFSNREKAIATLTFSKDMRVLSTTQWLGDLFALSMLHRLLSITTSSAKLYLDNSHIHPLYKYATSFALTALPALFLIYVVGYPPADLILNSCISQAAAVAISYCSFKAGNYLRSLELISHDKEFSQFSYLSRLLISSAIDILLTLCWHGSELYTNPLKQDDYHILKYCMNKTPSGTDENALVTMFYLAQPLISVADKIVWTLGRVVLDGIILGLHSKGIIQDIRSPFINAFSNTNLLITQTEEREYNNKRSRFTRQERYEYKKLKKAEEARKEEKNPSTCKENRQQQQPFAPESDHNINKDTDRTRQDPHHLHKREKKKTKSSTPSLFSEKNKKREINAQAENTINFDSRQKFNIEDYTLYEIPSPHLPKNTLGVISLKKTKGNENIFERSLSNANMANRCSSIKFLKSLNIYEIRPASTGDRIIGNLYKGLNGFTELFPLGTAIQVYDELKTKGGGAEPNLIIFNERVKHENIGRG